MYVSGFKVTYHIKNLLVKFFLCCNLNLNLRTFIKSIKLNTMKSLLLSLISLLALNSYAQNVIIPDANFKAYLVGNASINTNTDSEIQVSEATAFTGFFDCTSLGISDLTGIEAFTNIILLLCAGNQLTSIDVSNNTALTQMFCDYNLLVSLDVSNNAALTILSCGDNQLTSLDVSNNAALTSLGCRNNQLTSLDISNNDSLTVLEFTNNQLTSVDVSNNTNLTDLYCSDNQLTSLDMSNNIALTVLECNSNALTCLNVKNGNNFNHGVFRASNNINLICIEVDDVAWSNANWTLIDVQASFSTDCNNTCSSIVGLNELSNTPKQLLKIVDLKSRETLYKPNTPLIYIYSDGTAEKVFKMEE